MTDQVIDTSVDQNQTATSDDKIVATPTPDTEAAQDENITQGVVEKTYTQKEYDEATAKIRKKAEAVAERRALKAYSEKLEAMQQKPVEKPVVDSGKPTIAQFGDDVEAYVEAVADWKLQQRDNEYKQRNAEQQQAQIRSKADNLYAEAEKLPGFDVVAFEASLTPSIAGAVIESDIAPKLMAYISENPDEMKRIATLSPARQAVEIGKLEATLSVAKQTKVSSAPAPIKPVGGRSGMSSKPLGEMNIEELRAYEKTRGARYV
jgi:hypothetical protein